MLLLLLLLLSRLYKKYYFVFVVNQHSSEWIDSNLTLNQRFQIYWWSANTHAHLTVCIIFVSLSVYFSNFEEFAHVFDNLFYELGAICVLDVQFIANELKRLRDRNKYEILRMISETRGEKTQRIRWRVKKKKKIKWSLKSTW